MTLICHGDHNVQVYSVIHVLALLTVGKKDCLTAVCKYYLKKSFVEREKQ